MTRIVLALAQELAAIVAVASADAVGIARFIRAYGELRALVGDGDSGNWLKKLTPTR